MSEFLAAWFWWWNAIIRLPFTHEIIHMMIAKYGTCSLGFIFKETVQWKQLLLLTTWILSCRTMATLSSQKFKPDSVQLLIFSWNKRSISNHKKSTCLLSQGWPERLQFHLSPREQTLPGMGKGNIHKTSPVSIICLEIFSPSIALGKTWTWVTGTSRDIWFVRHLSNIPVSQKWCAMVGNERNL